ncbi:MAG: DUF2750 domain-containing protein [Gammaproteobacteria bacterium]|nr:DUF2750 domain-containing protein [Gammaproteobacteria bacterium]MDH5629221.1 DUF2750 domain-containing protein [Gammaproteobacteria bacterium]
MTQNIDFFQSYQQFLNNVLDSGEVWVLHGEHGCAVCESGEFESSLVFLFFSSETLALSHCQGEWSVYKPELIDIDSFIDDWLSGLHEDEHLIGLDWSIELEGAEIQPLLLMDDLLEDDD